MKKIDRGNREHFLYSKMISEEYDFSSKIKRFLAIDLTAWKELIAQNVLATFRPWRQYTDLVFGILISYLLVHFTAIPVVIFCIFLGFHCAVGRLWFEKMQMQMIGKNQVESLNVKEKTMRMLGALLSILASIPGFYLLLTFNLEQWFLLASNKFFFAGILVICLAIILASFFVSSRIHELFQGISTHFSDATFGEAAADDSVLLLRSFNDDNMKAYFPISYKCHLLRRLVWPRERFENIIAFTSDLFFEGNLIAIGRPGEAYPQLGALRTYVDDGIWKNEVVRSATRVQKIILIAGSTQGLGWEISKMKQLDLLNKTLMIIPPLNEIESEKRVEQLLRDLGLNEEEYSDKLKEESCFVTGLMAHDENGTLAYYHSGRNWYAYALTEIFFNVGLQKLGFYDGEFNNPNEKNDNEEEIVQKIAKVEQRNSLRPTSMDIYQRKLVFRTSNARRYSEKGDYKKAWKEYKKLYEQEAQSNRNDGAAYVLFACISEGTFDELNDAEAREMYKATNRMIDYCDVLEWAWLGDLDYERSDIVKLHILEAKVQFGKQFKSYDEQISDMLDYANHAETLKDADSVYRANVELGKMYKDEKEYEKAIVHIDIALKAAKDFAAVKECAEGYLEMSECYCGLSNYQLALENGERAYDYYNRGDFSTYGQAYIAYWCGLVAEDDGNDELAKKWYLTSLDCDRGDSELENWDALQREVHKNLGSIYERPSQDNKIAEAADNTVE